MPYDDEVDSLMINKADPGTREESVSLSFWMNPAAPKGRPVADQLPIIVDVRVIGPAVYRSSTNFLISWFYEPLNPRRGPEAGSSHISFIFLGEPSKNYLIFLELSSCS